jgi:predicted N-acetyltransferase YhbS
MITERELFRDEIPLIWTIDRGETIENIYRLEDHRLVLRPHYVEVPGWPPGEAEKYTPILLECFDRGGWFYGAFEGAQLIAIVILDNQRLGAQKDQLQLKFLYVNRSHRNRGMATRLFGLARASARARGARRLYISATPTENTVKFYLRLGCTVGREPDAELFALEPDDIHLECTV